VYSYVFIVTGLREENQMDTMDEPKQFDEELYTRYLEEGYNIYDEKYVRWLLLKHPNEVCSDWLDKTPSR